MATKAKVKPKRMTAEQFLHWAIKPQNAGRNLELDAGEVVEVPPPQHPHGVYCWLTSKLLTEYLDSRGDGYLCTNETGILVEREPDTVRGADLILFMTLPADGVIKPGYIDTIPNLIVEVISPSDTEKRINRRVNQYLNRGIPLVWLINFENTTVSVCRPNEFPKVLDETDELTGNGVLPGFSCKVADLFALPAKKPARHSKKGRGE